MKTTLLLGASIAALMVAAPAFAAASGSVQTTALTGVYLGIYGGYDWSDLDTSFAAPKIEPTGWEGGVFVGYKLDALMARMNGFGIGLNGAIEAFYGISNSEERVGAFKMEKDNEWGVSFRPGFSFISNATKGLGLNPYGILGYRNTKFEGTGGGYAGSERYDGFELGLGTELIAFGNFGVRAEYSHTWYGEESGIDPASDDVRMGLSYHF